MGLTKQREINITKQELIDFESDIAKRWEGGQIKAPVHLSFNNEEYLIDFFQYINSEDWVFSTWRNHYHSILHGVPKEVLLEEILLGNSISFQSPKHHIYTSAIVGGILPIAVGTALGLKYNNSDGRVFCFVGDMAAESGVFYEAVKYSVNKKLPIHFIIEDNNLSTNSPTDETWGGKVACDYFKNGNLKDYVTYFNYKREVYPHVGIGKFVHF
ncbi:MAG: thiamine pyrophosphate-dependent enzyme [Candidatus Omnitrophica bacterium]|jgi:pyruvate dehydrogenase E1 component alpha subunit|nr:thiamine pyrophosphate-dependent enzyme [Candidatus Omnitrophota bacterium]